jgi:hypothetical protein
MSCRLFDVLFAEVIPVEVTCTVRIDPVISAGSTHELTRQPVQPAQPAQPVQTSPNDAPVGTGGVGRLAPVEPDPRRIRTPVISAKHRSTRSGGDELVVIECGWYTADLAADAIRDWRRQKGKRQYQDATALSIEADGGGATGRSPGGSSCGCRSPRTRPGWR